MSNGSSRWARLFFFGAALSFPLAALVACGSDDDEQNGSSATVTDYVPTEAAAQNPLPPGAGPRPDTGVVTPPPPPPTDAAGDTSAPMDVNVPETSPTDAGAADGTVG